MATDGENDRSWQNVISSNLSAAGSEVDFEEISQRFEEYRKGKEPSIEEYAERYPEFASDILELFPSMLILEKRWKSASISGLGYASPTKDRPKLERLKNFKILREIGHGGMGVVYEAWDETLRTHGRAQGYENLSGRRRDASSVPTQSENRRSASPYQYHTGLQLQRR